MTEPLFDPMKHPDWISPQTAEWYSRLSLETGEYKYPWMSHFDKLRAEDRFGETIASCLNKDASVLDVGCGHGDFTTRFADKAKEVVGIDSMDGYIASAKRQAPDSLTFLVVDAHQPLPFTNASFDVVYTKKGPWLFHNGMVEGHRIIKSGGIVLGLYHCGTDGGFRSLFPGLYSPLPDTHLKDIKVKYEQQLYESGLLDCELKMIEEVEYLVRPEDVLIKKCFGQKESLKKVVWQKCLHQVEEIFARHAVSKGLRVVNYHVLLSGKAK